MSIFERMKQLIYFLLVALLYFASCKKEATTWTSEYAAPLVFTSLNISDIVNDSNLLVHPDSSLSLHIEREIYRLNIDSLFTTPDTTISEVHAVAFPGTISVSAGFTFISDIEESTFNVSGAELKYISLNGGRLNYEIISYVTGPTIDSIKIPSATKHGSEFLTVIHLEESDGTIPTTVTGSVDLSDYEFDLTGSDGLKYNTLISNISTSIDPTHSTPVDISNADSVRINVSFENIDPGRALGYFGNELVEVPLDTVSIPFMDKIIGGNLDLDDIDLSLSITNGIGVDIQSTVNELNSISSIGTVALSHSTIGSPINLNRPSRTGWVVNSSEYTTTFNNSSSNLTPFIENLPNQISYDTKIQINPFGDVNSHGDFYHSDYPLKADIVLDLPLCLGANNLTLQDTIQLSVDQDTSQIKSGTLKIHASNHFPLGAEVQVYLSNGANGFADSVVSQPIIAPAVVNSFNEVIAPTASELLIELDTEQIHQLIHSGIALIKVIFNTTNLPNRIKLKDWYHIDLNVGAMIKYKHEVN